MSKYGVLLPVSSLPGPHGIGDFGKKAYKFINWLKKNDYSYWQILPLNPIGPGHSPYMSSCSEAIDPRYISLDELAKQGYLRKVKIYRVLSSYVNYEKVWAYKSKYLRFAFKQFKKRNNKSLERFEEEHPWVRPYAIFLVLQEKNDHCPWNTWPKCDQEYNCQKGFPKGKEDECLFHEWCQMVAYEQWDKVRSYAKEQGIQIIADCPFYVGIESSDCWNNKEEFMFNENYEPTVVSGCPPDAFSEDGQLWGTPIYNFEKMNENGYSFLVNRIGNLAKMCDILRLDHFRAFDTYCVIPGEDTNARRGEWKEGPRYDFFDHLYQQFPDISLIAEDLGEIFNSVHELRDHYNLPGMFVVEFMVFCKDLTSNENQIVYPGTHDNQTIRGWIRSLEKRDRYNLKRKLGNPRNLEKAFASYCWNLPSKITIFQMQDLLRLDDNARMNFPGTLGSPNWEWKLRSMHELYWPRYKKVK